MKYAYTILTMAMLAAGCQPLEVHFETPDSDMSDLNFGEAGSVALEAPIGLEERLPQVAGQLLQARWVTQDRRPVDLEVQIQIVDSGSGSAAGLANRLAWSMSAHAHGGTGYKYPVRSDLAGVGPDLPTWSLPARGMRARVSARELSVSVAQLFGFVGQGPLVRISIQPADGSVVPVWPNSVTLDTSLGQPFPMGAVEWRLAGIAPATTITLRDLAGATLTTAPASAFADWTPIPPNAVSIAPLAGASAVAIFR